MIKPLSSEAALAIATELQTIQDALMSLSRALTDQLQETRQAPEHWTASELKHRAYLQGEREGLWAAMTVITARARALRAIVPATEWPYGSS